MFGGAIMDCLQAVVNGRTLSELGESATMKVEPATAADRKWAPPGTPAEAPVWMTEKLGYALLITEPSADRCEVHALQLPVDRTFRAVAFALTQALPGVQPEHIDPGYDPIAYQLRAVIEGTPYIIHMEGAEPGTPGHELRFSLLYAYVLKQPPQHH